MVYIVVVKMFIVNLEFECLMILSGKLLDVIYCYPTQDLSFFMGELMISKNLSNQEFETMVSKNGQAHLFSSRITPRDLRSAFDSECSVDSL